MPQNQIYEASFEGISKEDFEMLKSLFATDPGLVNDNRWADYELIDRDGSGGVSIDDHVDIDIPGDNGSVVVQDVAINENGFYANFATLEGHPDAGFIHFGGFYNADNGALTFRINNTTRTNTGMSAAVLPMVGARLAQQAQWRKVLGNVSDIVNSNPVNATQRITLPNGNFRQSDITDNVIKNRRN